MAKEPNMELTVTVDGNMLLSVSYHNGNVVFYWRDSGNCDVAEVALTLTQAKALGLGFIACAEEDEQ